ncbi:MAG: GNAT family N-acetyltransferase [Anaerolineae bacterium]
MERAEFTIRRAEPGDYEAVRRVLSGPKAVWGTLQLPYPTAEFWRRRMAEPVDGYYSLLACAGNDVVGELGLITFPNAPRRRHAARIGMAVRDDWQGKGAGTALMQATVDFAENWLNIMRLELEVFTDNEPAIRLYKRFGFVIEGTMPCFGFRDGKYVDVYAMGRVRKT